MSAVDNAYITRTDPYLFTRDGRTPIIAPPHPRPTVALLCLCCALPCLAFKTCRAEDGEGRRGAGGGGGAYAAAEDAGSGRVARRPPVRRSQHPAPRRT